MSDTSSTALSAAGSQDARFSPITDDDKAGILWIASLLAGVYAVLSMIVRTYIKRKCFGHDDWMCLAATVCRHGPLLLFAVPTPYCRLPYHACFTPSNT